MSSTLQYAVKDRDGKINQEPGKKDAKRDQKAFGGVIMRSKGEGAFKPWKPHHVFLWFFLALQAGFILWLVTSGSAGDHQTTHCVAQNLTSGECKGASEVATGLAIGFEILIWVIVDFLVGLTYGIYRLVKR